MENITAVFGIDWKLLLAQLVNFGVVLFVLSYFVYKPLLRMIDERRETIAKGVVEAQAAATLRTDAEAAAQLMTNEASLKASTIVAEGKRASEALAQKKREEADAEATRILTEAKTRAEEAQAKAVQSAREDIARLSILAAEKVLKERVS